MLRDIEQVKRLELSFISFLQIPVSLDCCRLWRFLLLFTIHTYAMHNFANNDSEDLLPIAS